jgi:hypothetical protein
LKENTSIFYEYDLIDGDTPEIIASKLYDSPEKHWIVLMMNDIIDPQTEWPLDYYTLNQYIDKKYLPSANSTTSGDGLAWSKSNVKDYFLVKRQTLPNQNMITKQFRVDSNTYSDIQIVLGEEVTLENDIIVVFDTDKTTQSYYDYELEENEAKRKIKLLRREYVSALEEELERSFL